MFSLSFPLPLSKKVNKNIPFHFLKKNQRSTVISERDESMQAPSSPLARGVACTLSPGLVPAFPALFTLLPAGSEPARTQDEGGAGPRQPGLPVAGAAGWCSADGG